ncbi:MAG: 4Fe-4S binding protein [Trueperaceae bacterium]
MATQAGKIELPTYKPIAEQPKGFDLFRLPLLRAFIRWKYARFVFQLPLLALALFVIVDGFTGYQLSPRNVATTSVWLHYRGFVAIALAIFGNAFCAACPLILTRGATKRLERLLPNKLTFPKFLRNKYFVTALLLFYFFSYEYFNLWSSPWLTAWLAVSYFGAALVVDTLFPAGTFCRYVCPLGNFNFVMSSASPTQITAIDHDVCRQCEHKPCLQGRYSDKERGMRDEKTSLPTPHSPLPTLPLQTNGHNEVAFILISDITHPNGRGHFPGCETELFVPTIQSNMDCTLCFNCVRACPYDNVALTVRKPGWEWTRAPWLKRGRFALMLMGVMLTFYGLLNAVAMVPPYYAFAQFMADTLRTNSELLLLSLFFIVLAVGGFLSTLLMSTLADLVGGARLQPLQAFQRWGYVVVILGVGFWVSHYIYHLLTGALTIIPVFQHFFNYRGFAVDPNWRLGQVIPSSYFFIISAAITTFYSFLAMYVTVRIGLRDFGKRGVLAMWLMFVFVIVFTVLALLVFNQPMEMRGTIFKPSF